MKLIFGNFAKSTLALPLAPGDTTMTVAAGTGALYPSPAAGEYFVVVLTDHVTKALHEVVWVTARSGDAMTITRAQEGTTAASWIVSDLVQVPPTGGQMAALAQLGQPVNFTSGAFTLSVTGVTEASGDNSTKFATTAWFQTEFPLHAASQATVDARTNTAQFVNAATLAGAASTVQALFQASSTAITTDFFGNATFVSYSKNIGANTATVRVSFSGLPAFVNSPRNFLASVTCPISSQLPVVVVNSTTLEFVVGYWDNSTGDGSDTWFTPVISLFIK